MPIKILAVGKKHASWLEEAVLRYEKRLKPPFICEWVFLPASAQKGPIAAQEESERIKHKLHDDDFTILLDERGKLLNSPAFSRLLAEPLERSQNVTVIIGGAYGVTEELRDQARFVLSLSPLVFPHQLVRLLLLEQLYRAQSIHFGQPYHNA